MFLIRRITKKIGALTDEADDFDVRIRHELHRSVQKHTVTEPREGGHGWELRILHRLDGLEVTRNEGQDLAKRGFEFTSNCGKIYPPYE